MKKHKLKILFAIITILSFLGFLDSTYIAILHYQNITPPCSVVKGCELVLSSKFSTIGTIPLALLGSIYYLTMMGLSVLLIQAKGKKMKLFLIFSAAVGFLISLSLFLIQAFVLRAFCQYCLLSETISTAILTVSVILVRIKNRQKKE